MDKFEFFYGAASGQSRAALRKLEEPNVMINYATKNNEPWDGIERLCIDSGGYSFMLGKGEYETTAREYTRWLAARNPDLWVLRDYPCEPDVLAAHNRTVDDHQRMTVDAHRRVADAADDISPGGRRITVLQGQSVNDYLDHYDMLQEQGLVTDYVGIGSVCGRENINQVRRVILAVAQVLSDTTDLHAFGVKRTTLLQFDDVVRALSSADSLAYDMRGQYAALSDDRPFSWQECAYQYLRFKRRMQGIHSNDTAPEDLRPECQTGLDELTDITTGVVDDD